MERAKTNTCLDLVESCTKDDLTNFIRLVENGRCNMDEDIPWLTCPIGCDNRKVLTTTPLMIAAICEKVVEYILRSGLDNVDKPSPSDGATAIECAYDAMSSTRIILMLSSSRSWRGQLDNFDQNSVYSHISVLSSTASYGQSHLNSMINAPSMHQMGPGMAELIVERSSVDCNMKQGMSGKQVPAIMNCYGHARGSSLDAGLSSSRQQQRFNFIQSMQGRQEPNILTSPYATVNNYGHTGGVAAGERPLSSDHLVYQNMSHNMQGRQEPEVIINSLTPGPGIMNKHKHTQGKAAADDDWPSLMEDVLSEVRKLLNSTQK